MHALAARFLVVALTLPVLAAAQPTGEVEALQSAILRKLEYDRSYFRQVLSLERQNKRLQGTSRAEFAREVERGRASLPALERFFKEREGYARGEPLTLPGGGDSLRVYTNLFSLLNMLQSYRAGRHEEVLERGRSVRVSKRDDFGRVRQGQGSRYYLDLYREYFFLMAAANYRLDRDGAAVEWFARLESDANLKKLKDKLDRAEDSVALRRSERLALLATRPVAVLPLEGVNVSEEAKWIGAGAGEVIANDLLQFTDLLVLERAQLARVLKEIALGQAGITEPRNVKALGRMTQAGALITGQYRVVGAEVVVSLRLLDAETGESLAGTSGQATREQLFARTRVLLAELLRDAEWLAPDALERMSRARSPKTDTVRDLLQARLLLASKSDRAKELYEKALKEDPAYARAFEDLEKEFTGVHSTVAVMPFVNISGIPSDGWMVHGAAEALSTDLPQIGFNVVERAQLALQLKEREIGQVIEPERVRKLGQLLGADFTLVGSVLHQAPRLRIDARFVDVGTGAVLESFDVAGSDRELPKLLAQLSMDIARRFNAELPPEVASKLAGARMSVDEFKELARQQLSQESLTRRVNPPEPLIEEDDEALEPKPDRRPFWMAVGGTAAGSAIAVAGLSMGGKHLDAAGYSDGLLQSFAGTQADQDRLVAYRDAQVGAGITWNAIGFGGMGLALFSAGWLAYQELFPPAPPPTVTTSPVTAPSPSSDRPTLSTSVAPTPGGGASLSVFGRF